MKVKEMMGKVMAALDEVTSFDLTANLEDYRYKIYEAMDSTQRELAAMVSPILKTEQVTVTDGFIPYPSDMYELITIMNEDYSTADFTIITSNIIRIANGNYFIVYNKYPVSLCAVNGNEQAIENIELEISREAQEAMVYGVCAFLCINDEPDLYNTYMSRYTAYMSNILNRKEQKPKASVKGGVCL